MTNVPCCTEDHRYMDMVATYRTMAAMCCMVMNMGTDMDTDMGMDMNTDTGTDPDMDMGTDPGMDMGTGEESKS